MNNKLINWKTFNPSKIIFSELKEEGKAGKRISLSYQHPDGTCGQVLFATVKDRFSFGVQHNTDIDNRDVIVAGHKLSMNLYSQVPTPEEKAWVKFYEDILMMELHNRLKSDEMCNKLKFAGNNKLKFTANLLNFGDLYRKKDKETQIAVKDDSNPPKLYAKLKEWLPQEAKAGKPAKEGKVLTVFRAPNKETIPYEKLIGVKCSVTAVLCLESIFIGNKVSPQVKVYEARVRLHDNIPTSLLTYDEADEMETKEETQGFVAQNLLDDVFVPQKDDDTGSIQGDEEEEEKPPPPRVVVVKKKVVRPEK